MFIVTPIVVVCDWSMFCFTLLYFYSSFAIILMWKRELVALLSLSLVSRDCCVALTRGAMGCLQFVIVVITDHTHLLLYRMVTLKIRSRTPT